MAEITNDLIYEILKKLQVDLGQIKATQADHSRQLIRVREDINALHTDMNGLRGDDLRRETVQAQMANRLEHIESRLNLSDA